MTDRLTSTLHERADAEQFDVPDVDALVRTGERRVRHRRTALVAGCAALAVVAGVALAQTLPGRGSAPQPAPSPEGDASYPVTPRDLPPMVVAGSTAWVDGRTVTLEAPVDELVRTREGWAYRSGDRVWSRTDRGTVLLEGVSGDLMTSDEDGVLVGLYDLTPDGGLIRVLDQRSGRLTTVVDGLDPESGLVAVDGDHLYWYDAEGAWSTDLVSGERDPAPEGVFAVESGAVAHFPGADAGVTTQLVAADGSTVDLEWGGDVGALSPDGAWYAADDLVGFPEQRAGVVELATGRRVELRTGATDRDLLVLVAGWLDARTLQVGVVPRADGAPSRLLTCRVPSGACTVVLDDVSGLASPQDRFTGRVFVGPAA